MKLIALTPVFRTWELQETIAFYTGALGFQVDGVDAGEWLISQGLARRWR